MSWQRWTSATVALLVGCAGEITEISAPPPPVERQESPAPEPVPAAVPKPPVAAPREAPAPPPPAVPALDAGRTTLRRLTRAEYANTVRDLLGTALRPAERLPGDEVDHGFDTLGSAVSVSPVHVEVFEGAAADLVDELLALPAGDPRRGRVLPCPGFDEACLRTALRAFARRAYRRPLADPELDRLLGLAARARAATGQPEDGLRAALQAVLVSPHFLFRIELDPAPRAAVARPVSPHELAVRLSYFLWTSMPDEPLLAAAAARRLGDDPAELERQVERMLADPKSEALTEHFAGQWLFTRAIEQFEPQKATYPTWDQSLRQAMKVETETFFEALVRDALPLETILTADFSFANDRLARHYGLPAGAGDRAKKVSLLATPRRGLLTHGSFLVATSQPDRTSPVKRGVWVLEQLLCAPPPPAPPEVEALPAARPGERPTLRQRLERHRDSPSCAACHRLIDPIGLGLEAFDGVGAHRTLDEGQPVDATGELPDGTRFSGAAELASLLARDARFVPCLAEQMLTYATGRPFRDAEAQAYVEGVAREVRARGATWRALVTAVVASDAFRTRRGEP